EATDFFLLGPAVSFAGKSLLLTLRLLQLVSPPPEQLAVYVQILSHLRQAQATLLQQPNRLHFELLGVRPTRLSHISTTPLPPIIGVFLRCLRHQGKPRPGQIRSDRGQNPSREATDSDQVLS